MWGRRGRVGQERGGLGQELSGYRGGAVVSVACGVVLKAWDGWMWVSAEVGSRHAASDVGMLGEEETGGGADVSALPSSRGLMRLA